MNARRWWALGAGSLVVGLTVVAPLPWWAGQLLVLHTLQHMALLALAAPLLVYASEPLLYGGPRRVISLLSHPVGGLAAFTAVLCGWQIPVAFDAAARLPLLHQAAHASFLLGAAAFWWPVIRAAGPRRLSTIGKLGYLVLAGVPPTVPAVVLALSRVPYYASIGPYGLFGLTPVEDQQLAGVLLFATAKFALVAGTFVILWRLLEEHSEPPGEDRRDTGPPDSPPTAPAWLHRLDEQLPAEPAALRPRARLVRSGARDMPSAKPVEETRRALRSAGPAG